MGPIQFIIILCYVCIAIVGLCVSTKRLSTATSIFISTILMVIIVFRPENMADYYNYKVMFTDGEERVEPFFQLLIAQANVFHLDYLITFSIIALVSVSLKMIAINKMTSLPMLSILIWISQILIIQDMIAIRSACAAALLLWIIFFKVNDQHKLMWICIMTAICCHYTALVFIIIPFISKSKPRRLLYIIILFISMFLALTNFTISSLLPGSTFGIYNDLLTTYLGSESANPFNLLQLYRCGICFLLWYIIPKINESNKYLLVCTKAYTIGCVLFFLCSQMISVAFRLEELFIVTEIILIPYLSFLFIRKVSYEGRLIPIILGSISLWFNITNSFWDAPNI